MKKGLKIKKKKKSNYVYLFAILILLVLFGMLFSLMEDNETFKDLKGRLFSEKITEESLCGNKIFESYENSDNCVSDCGYAVCNNNEICEGIENNENCPKDCKGVQISPEFKGMIDTIWGNKKQEFVDLINTEFLVNDHAYVIYDIEGYTINLLKYAKISKDYKIINDLAEVYLTPYKYLNEFEGHKVWTRNCYNPNVQNGKTNECTYSGNVELLSAAQFHYSITSLINAIAEIPAENRTSLMIDFVKNYTDVSVEFILFTEVGRGRNCKNYMCNLNGMTWDHDLLLAAGSAEILMANNNDPNLVYINETNKKLLMDFVNCSSVCYERRLVEMDLIDFNENPVKGFNIDPGKICTYHPELGYPDAFKFSNYNEDIFPIDESVASCSSTVSIDISHARRIPHCLETFYLAKSVTNQTFPEDSVMIRLANQIVYGVFNKDFKSPLFTNFLDGSKGWYQVSLVNGYGDGSFSYSKYAGPAGYAFLSKYNSDLYKVFNSVWKIYEIPDKDDSTISLVQNYYGANPQYYNFQKTIYSIESLKHGFDKSNSMTLLQFLPSLVTEKYCGNSICESDILENCSYCSSDCGECDVCEPVGCNGRCGSVEDCGVIIDCGSCGSGGGSSYSIYQPSNQEMSLGYNKKLKDNERINFNLGKEAHSLIVENIMQNFVELVIRSSPVYLNLFIGQSIKLNLSSNDYYDLLVKLENIENNQAEISVKIINETIKKQIEENQLVEGNLSYIGNNTTINNVAESPALDAGKVSMGNYIYYAVLILLAAVIAAVIFFLVKINFLGKENI